MGKKGVVGISNALKLGSGVWIVRVLVWVGSKGNLAETLATTGTVSRRTCPLVSALHVVQ